MISSSDFILVTSFLAISMFCYKDFDKLDRKTCLILFVVYRIIKFGQVYSNVWFLFFMQ